MAAHIYAYGMTDKKTVLDLVEKYLNDIREGNWGETPDVTNDEMSELSFIIKSLISAKYSTEGMDNTPIDYAISERKKYEFFYFQKPRYVDVKNKESLSELFLFNETVTSTFHHILEGVNRMARYDIRLQIQQEERREERRDIYDFGLFLKNRHDPKKEDPDYWLSLISRSIIRFGLGKDKNSNVISYSAKRPDLNIWKRLGLTCEDIEMIKPWKDVDGEEMSKTIRLGMKYYMEKEGVTKQDISETVLTLQNN